MPIRFKLTILLTLFAAVALAVLAWSYRQGTERMGVELEERIRTTLVRDSSIELKRLVEDHARVLQRDRELVGSALRFLAAALEGGAAGARVDTDADGDALQARLGDRYLAGGGHMRHRLDVDFDSVGVRGGDPETAQFLLRLQPVFESLAARHPELVLWQVVNTTQGAQAIYPRPIVRHMMPRGPGLRIVPSRTPQWAQPRPDPLTGTWVSTVSMAFMGPGGRAGTVGIAVPVEAMLHENKHIRRISREVASLIVRSAPDGDETSPIEVVARGDSPKEAHSMWSWVPKTNRAPLEATPDESYRAMAADMAAGRSGVREMAYSGRKSLFAYGPIDDAGGALLLIVPMDDVTAEARRTQAFVRARIQKQLRTTGLVLGAVFVAAIILAAVASRYVTVNIHRLVAASRRLATGDFETRVDIDTGDEIGELGRTFNEMGPALRERMEIMEALDVAREVQQSLLPENPPEIENVDIYGASRYCDQTGGDLYDYIAAPRGRVALCVGDVSGHGLHAALLMSSLRAYLRSGRADTQLSPADVVAGANVLLAEDTYRTAQFATLFYLELDPGSRHATWVRAGHDPALLYDPRDAVFRELSGEGSALGLDPDTRFEEQRLELGAGQVIVIFTDGIFEARSPEGEMFGRERLKQVVRDNAHHSARRTAQAVFEALDAFRGNGAREDDETLIVARIV